MKGPSETLSMSAFCCAARPTLDQLVVRTRVVVFASGGPRALNLVVSAFRGARSAAFDAHVADCRHVPFFYRVAMNCSVMQGLRQGEIASQRWARITWVSSRNWTGHTWLIATSWDTDTKNGQDRVQGTHPDGGTPSSPLVAREGLSEVGPAVRDGGRREQAPTWRACAVRRPLPEAHERPARAPKRSDKASR